MRRVPRAGAADANAQPHPRQPIAEREGGVPELRLVWKAGGEPPTHLPRRGCRALEAREGGGGGGVARQQRETE